ncbi:MAG: hypothetical protein QM765_07305 [Myxococcales bacterium]
MHPGKRRLAACAAFLCSFLVSCGAQDKEGPPPKAQPQKCQSLDAIAPALMETLKGSQSVQLRTVFEREHLFDDGLDGSPSPMKTLTRVALRTLTSMAHDDAEPGVAEGQLCNNANPPPSRESNRMCEARRILDFFVHQGKGNDLIRYWDPLLAKVLGYVVGAALEPPHYEFIGVLSASCTKAYCRTEDLLDVGIGMMAFMEPTVAEPDRPKNLLSLMHAILQDPGIGDLIDSAEANMGEEALVAFGNILLDNVMAFPTDPDQFAVKYHRDLEVKVNDLLTTTLKITREDPKSASLRKLLDQLVGAHELADLDKPHGAGRPLLMSLLDPNRPDPVLPALQRELNCLRKNDPNSSMMRLVFALGFKGEALGLEQILGALEDLADLDGRASIVTFLKRSFEMIRSDEEGIVAARSLCAKALDTTPAEGGGASNAELVIPVVEELFSGGASQELVCVTDSLLYGCASGPQPACF